MKVTEIEKDKRYTIVRASSRENWPENWGKACGFNDGRVPLGLQFHDGDFIGQSVDVLFDPKTPRQGQLQGLKAAVESHAGKRDMVNRWAARLPERKVILGFWEWLEKESKYIADAGINLDKVLDKYHEINRQQLDAERQAILDSAAPSE